jgi:hypothetical protein
MGLLLFVQREHFRLIGMHCKLNERFRAKTNKGTPSANGLHNSFAEDLLKVPQVKKGGKYNTNFTHTLPLFSFAGNGWVDEKRCVRYKCFLNCVDEKDYKFGTVPTQYRRLKFKLSSWYFYRALAARF